MLTKITEGILTALLIAVLTLVSNLAISYVFEDDSIVQIGDVIEIDSSNYQLSLNILNYSDKSINALRIKLPVSIDLKDIKVSQPIYITKIYNNVGTSAGEVLEIKSISENQKVQVVLLLSKSIDTKKIEIDKNGNKVEVKDLSHIDSPLKENYKSIVITAIVYSILLVCMNTLFDIRRRRQLAELRRYYDEKDKIQTQVYEVQEKSYKELREDHSDLKEKIQRVDTQYSKWKLIYTTRIRDYNKELNFWKDTIRKIIYEGGKGKIEVEKLFDVVTNTLKTYQTRKNVEDLEALNILTRVFESRQIRDDSDK